MEEITTMGLDIAKSVFQVRAVSATGTVVVKSYTTLRDTTQQYRSCP